MHVPKGFGKKEGYCMHFNGFDGFRGGMGGFDRFGQAGWFGQYAWLMPLMMLLFWIIVISLIVFFVRRSRHHMMAHDPRFENKALAIVKERYAKGEITKEEFDRLANDLKN
jgi:putative membrane protein